MCGGIVPIIQAVGTIASTFGGMGGGQSAPSALQWILKQQMQLRKMRQRNLGH
jgi:hypothetical protein